MLGRVQGAPGAGAAAVREMRSLGGVGVATDDWRGICTIRTKIALNPRFDADE